MKYLLGFVLGVIVATAGYGWAECCGAFNVPFDTQIAIDRQMRESRSLEPSPIPYDPVDRSLPRSREEPCER
jgi:hypothetical protein